LCTNLTFNQLLKATPNIRAIGIQVLRSWGYTDREAEQEALIALWDVSREDKQPKNVSAYIRVTLKNAEIDRTRKLQSRMEVVGITDEPFEKEQQFNLIWFFMLTENITHKHRRLLFQSYVLRYSGPELAKKYGVALGTIKSRLNRICRRVMGACR